MLSEEQYPDREEETGVRGDNMQRRSGSMTGIRNDLKLYMLIFAMADIPVQLQTGGSAITINKPTPVVWFAMAI